MDKTKVAVVFGGTSSEHDISLISVTSVLNNLDREKYEISMIGIKQSGEWFLYEGPVEKIKSGEWENDKLRRCVISPDRGHHGLIVFGNGDAVEIRKIDVVFPVLHGKNGEDGTIQGLLEIAGLPCVGCGISASANCMDKDLAKKILAQGGIKTAKWITVRPYDDVDVIKRKIEDQLGYPVFVKPCKAGSSVGITKIGNGAELKQALETAFAADDKVIIEETIKGSEVECAVMGSGSNVFASTHIGEIVPVRDLYDFEGKYLDGSTKLYIPARIPERQAQSIRKAAVEAYGMLECSGLSRVDFFALPDGKSFILNEINTMPGFTDISMYPKLMMDSGMTYQEILDRLIGIAKNA